MAEVANAAYTGHLRDLKEGGLGSRQKPASGVRIVLSNVRSNLENIQLRLIGARDLRRAHVCLERIRSSSVLRSRRQSFLAMTSAEPLRTPSRSFPCSSSAEETIKPGFRSLSSRRRRRPARMTSLADW